MKADVKLWKIDLQQKQSTKEMKDHQLSDRQQELDQAIQEKQKAYGICPK